MPWKETRVEHLRIEFVLRALEAEANHSGLCREYGISRRTGYKWLDRYRAQGVLGLSDASRRPLRQPLALTVEQVLAIVRLRQAHPFWGPKKLHALLQRQGVAAPAPSTIARVLARAQLTDAKGRGRPPRVWPAMASLVAAPEPNDLWTVDFKGWWRTGDRQRCEPFTARDAFSRYLLALQPVRHTDTLHLQALFTGLFERYGLPRRIRSDSGSPFASPQSPYGLTRLSAWWRLLGIQLERIAPGHPEQNGAHERMHGDVAREIEARPAADLAEETARLEHWRCEYNLQRPHEALAMKTPAEVYRRSPRRFPATLPSWEYPWAYDRRRVSPNGSIHVANRRYFVSEAFQGLDVGLERTGVDTVRLWFCDLNLGDLDLRLGTPLQPPAVAPSPNELKVSPMSRE